MALSQNPFAGLFDPSQTEAPTSKTTVPAPRANPFAGLFDSGNMPVVEPPPEPGAYQPLFGPAAQAVKLTPDVAHGIAVKLGLTNYGQETISPAPPQTFIQKAVEAVKNIVLPYSAEDAVARDQAVFALHKVATDQYFNNIADGINTGKIKVTTPDNKPAPLPPKVDSVYIKQHAADLGIPAEPISREDVSKNLSHFSETILGIPHVLTPTELASLIMVFPVGAAIIAAPRAALIGLAAWQAISEAENFAVSKSQGLTYKPLSGDGVADLLPSDVDPRIRTGVELLDFLAKAKALHAVYIKAPDVIQSWTKNLQVQYNLPSTLYIDAAKVKDIFQTGTQMSVEEAKLVQSLGLNAEGYKRAFQNGLSIQVPWEKVVTVTDKPYWAKFKQAILLKPTKPQVQRRYAGAPAEGPRALLPEKATPAPGVVPPPETAPPGAPPTVTPTPTPTPEITMADIFKPEVTPAANDAMPAIRDQMVALSKQIDQNLPNSQQIVDQTTALRDQLNTYTDANEEVVARVMAGGKVLAEIKAVPFSDGKWVVSVSASTSTGGFGSPYTFDTPAPNLEAATQQGKQFILDWAQTQFARADTNKTDQAQLKRIVKEIGNVPVAPTPVAQPAAEPVPANILDEVPAAIQEKAQADWEANYAERYGQLADQEVALRRQLKEAPKAGQEAIQKQLDVAQGELAALENKWLGEWHGAAAKTGGTPSQKQAILLRTYEELKSIPKDAIIERPEEFIAVSKDISMTRRSLKHIADKPADFQAERILRALPDILDNPNDVLISEKHGGNNEERLLFVRHRTGEKSDVAVVENKKIVITIFRAERRYLSKMSSATREGGRIKPSIVGEQKAVKQPIEKTVSQPPRFAKPVSKEEELISMLQERILAGDTAFIERMKEKAKSNPQLSNKLHEAVITAQARADVAKNTVAGMNKYTEAEIQAELARMEAEKRALKSSTKVNTPEGKAIIENINKTAGGFITEKQIPGLIDKLGQFTVVVKDVNGQRAVMNVSDFQTLSANAAFSDRIRAVWIPSGGAEPITQPKIDPDFMAGLKVDKLLSLENKPLELGILQSIEGLKLTNSSSISSNGKQKFIAMIMNDRVRGLLKENGITEINIRPPYEFQMSEQAHLVKGTGVININADATNPTDTILHELGHKKFESLSQSQQNALIESAKNSTDPRMAGYKKLEAWKEIIADSLYKNPLFAPDLYQTVPKELQPLEETIKNVVAVDGQHEAAQDLIKRPNMEAIKPTGPNSYVVNKLKEYIATGKYPYNRQVAEYIVKDLGELSPDVMKTLETNIFFAQRVVRAETKLAIYTTLIKEGWQPISVAFVKNAAIESKKVELYRQQTSITGGEIPTIHTYRAINLSDGRTFLMKKGAYKRGLPVRDFNINAGNEMFVRLVQPRFAKPALAAPTTPSIETAPRTFYRGGGEGAAPKGKTAQAIVDYERTDLGNADVKAVPGIDLSAIPAERVQWLTETKAAAQEYGAVEEVSLTNYRIVASDGQGGVLIEKMPAVPRFAGKASEEFKVGDVIETSEGSKQTIREIKGNSIYFTDENGQDYSGFARSTLRNLVNGGSWKKITGKATPAPEPELNIGDLQSKAKGGKIETHGKAKGQPSGERAGSGIGPKELPETLPVGTEQPGDAGKPAQERGGRVARGRSDVGGGSAGKRHVATLETNEQITDFVGKYTTVDDDGRVIVDIGKLTADGFDLSDFDTAAKNYTPAGGLEKKGAEGRGLLDEYYTPTQVVDLLKQAVNSHLPEPTTKPYKILEPAVGTGRFLQDIPKGLDLGDKIDITGYEINRTAAGIAAGIERAISRIYNLPFEDIFIDKHGNKKEFRPEYDLVIGNPPYGEHRGVYKGLGEETRIAKYEEYFIKRSLDLTKDGGIVAMVVPSGILRSGSSFGKNAIVQLGKLIDAYRLPNKIFGTTDIGTDILVFRKSVSGEYTGVSDRLNILTNDAYFDLHPDKIIGTEAERKGRFGVEKFVTGDLADVAARLKIKKEPEVGVEPVTPQEETQLKEVVGANYPQETAPEKKDILNAVEEEIATGQITNVRAYVKNWNRDVNKVEPKAIEGKLKPRFTKIEAKLAELQAAPEKKLTNKVVLQPIKKDAGIINLQDLGTLKDAQEIKIRTNIEATGEIKGEVLKELSDEDLTRLTNYSDGLLYDNFNYFAGNIYDRLDQLEKDKPKIPAGQYEKQKKGLLEVLPERHPIERIDISPNTPFAGNTLLYDKDRERDISLKEAFKDFLRDLPQQAFGDSSRYEISEYIDEQAVRGSDKARNNLVRVRRREIGDRLFGLFLRDNLDKAQQKIVEDTYNRQFNGYFRPDYSQVPLTGKVYDTFKGKKLDIKPVQLQGIGFLINKGMGLLAHDVGVGKTMQAIITTGEMMQRGWSKKPLIVTPPGNVYHQWIKEIQDLLPDVKINDLANLGGEFKGDLATLTIEPGTISIMTYEGFKRLGFTDSTYVDLTGDLQDTIENPDGEVTKRGKELEKAQVSEQIGVGMKGTKAGKYFEDLGFDLLVQDEVQNANHIIKGAKLKEQGKATEFRGLTVRPSALGIKTWLASQYIQKHNNNRNVFLLSATPFTNNPMEYYSVLSLLARKRLQEMGLKNVNEFMNTFMDLTFDFEVTADGKYQERNAIRGFKNYQQFQKLLTEFIDFRDGEEAGVSRPNRISNEIVLHATQQQFDLMDKAQELFSPEYADKAGKLLGIGEMRKITFSPYASRFYQGPIPTYKEFVDNSPKIKAAIEAIKQNKKDNPGANQVIYSPIGVEYFPLIKDYLVHEVGFKDKEVGIMTGSINATKRVFIQENFNKGNVKVIIGSDAIQEGVNLQQKTTDLYLLALPWNFTELKQIIGRVWRQGNEWENIRVHNVFIENSIDVFQSQKLETKQKRYENALKFKGDYLDVGDISFDELKLDLITDPVMRVEVEHAVMTRKLNKDLMETKADYAYFARKAQNLTDMQGDIDRTKYQIEKASKLANEGDEYYKEMLPKYEARLDKELKELEKIKADYREKGILDMSELAKKQSAIDAKEAMVKSFEADYQAKIKEARGMRVERVTRPNDFNAISAKLAQDNPAFFVKAKPAGTKVEAPRGAGEASVGAYLEGEPILMGGIDKIRPVEFPEMVELATEIIGQAPRVKKMRKALGRFTPKGQGRVTLAPGLFDQKSAIQLAKTMAHEIGHLTDYVPDLSLKHGNLKNRILVVRNDMIKTFGESVKNSEYRDELKAASQMWRPWDRAVATESMRKYRDSGKELYADAISMLYNNPGLLEKAAPKFYQAYFESLDNKPEMKTAYFDLQEVLSGTREELIARRRAGVQRMFQEGDYKALELQKQKQVERTRARKDLVFRLKTQLIDKNYTAYSRVRKLQKQGVIIPQDEDPRYVLEERNYIGGLMKAFTEKNFQPVYQTIEKSGIGWTNFGEALMYERIIAGDRSDIANPRGLSPANAQELYDSLRAELGPEKAEILKSQIEAFREPIKATGEEAFKEGLYTPELHNQMQANPAYVSFMVIEHLESEVTSRVYHQIGTLKGIINPADASILKTLAVKRAIEFSRAKKVFITFLENYNPQDIKEAKDVWTGKGRRPIQSKNPNEKLITYYEAGKLKGKYVDPYVADSINNASVGENLAVVQVLKLFNSKLFRPLYITFNLGFQAFNLLRDFWRFWKAIPGMTVLKAIRRYSQSVSPALIRAFGLPENPTPADLEAHRFIQSAEEAKLLSLTFNDLVSGRQVEDTQIEDILSRVGVGSFKPKAIPWYQKPFKPILDFIERTGNAIETLPKAAGIFEFKGKGTIADLTPEQRSFIRRKIGSPDFFAGGTFKPVSNEVLLFSNAITQATRADYELATEPRTRSGYWWKTIKLTFLPKLLMYGALLGLFGTAVQRIMQSASEYDRTNYIVIPLGEDENGNGAYMRFPQDDSGRLLGGIFWKALQIARGDVEAAQTIQQVLDYTAGQFPTPAPILQALTSTTQFLAGQNPYDFFRGRSVLTDQEFRAHDARGIQKFWGWEFQQLGGGIFWKFYAGEQRPEQQALGQRILQLPIISNIIGRFIKISNYGQVEALRQEAGKVQTQEARLQLDQRSLINQATRDYQKLPVSEQTTGKVRSMAKEITDQLYAGATLKERLAQRKEMEKKLKLSITRSGTNPVIDALFSATSNDQKTAVLIKASRTMATDDFDQLLKQAQKAGLLSFALKLKIKRQVNANTR